MCNPSLAAVNSTGNYPWTLVDPLIHNTSEL